MTETPHDQAPDTTSAPRAVVVPEKPALEGLEGPVRPDRRVQATLEYGQMSEPGIRAAQELRAVQPVGQGPIHRSDAHG